jgi:hypothetical protein
MYEAAGVSEEEIFDRAAEIRLNDQAARAGQSHS